ncbi:MAG: iron-containing alcohol dehydrogenase [Clostridia bacterium]|nr:iron-containing alcohol dehydrogenase [Clostridia bacterium]
MKRIERLFCRTYQLAFRAALPILPYTEPQTLCSLDAAVQLLGEKKISSILLIADGGVYALGLCAPLEESLQASGISCAVYLQKTPNPTIENVETARKAYLEAGAQAIIAVGGGSAMDCAKVVGARIAKPDQPVEKMRGLLRILKKTPLMIAVPTTAGTGSETTLAAVITDEKTHHKYPINDFSLIPEYAVLDAKLTLGLPPHITATTGMDALTHAIEAYIGRSTTAFTRAMAEEAVTLIAANLKEAVQNGKNETARANMLRASYCAGVAFTRSYVGYVHGIAHSLGGKYGIAHGLANAVILPVMLRRYGAACEKQLAALARLAGVADKALSDSQAALAFILWIEEMNRSFSLPKGFSQICEEDIPEMAARAAKESNPLYPVPVLMDAQELEKIYHQLMEA